MTHYLETAEFLHDFLQRRRCAYDALFEKHFKTIFLFSFKLTGDESQAEDIAIESFMKLYADPERFADAKGIGNILACLYVIARNASLDYIKKHRRLKQREKAFHSQFADDNDLDYAIMEGHIMTELYFAIEKLPNQYKAVLQLIYGQGYSYRETADSMGISIHTVKSHKTAAVRKIREHMLDKNMPSTLVLLTLYFSLNN